MGLRWGTGMADGDFRIAFGWRRHWNRRVRPRLLGPNAVLSLEDLWAFTAENKPDGDLSGMSDDAIEAACDWTGDRGALVSTLANGDLRLLDGVPGSRVLHDWAEHQPYIVTAPWRHDRAQKAANARWTGRETLPTKAPPKDATSMLPASPKDAGGKAPDADLPSHVGETVTDHASSNAPVLACPSLTDPGRPENIIPRPPSQAPGGTAPNEPVDSPLDSPKTSPSVRIQLDKEAGAFSGILPCDVARWMKACPKSLPTEGALGAALARAASWCLDNPKDAPKSNVASFITRWLNRAERAAERRAPTGSALFPAHFPPSGNGADSAWIALTQQLAAMKGWDDAKRIVATLDPRSLRGLALIDPRAPAALLKIKEAPDTSFLLRDFSRGYNAGG